MTAQRDLDELRDIGPGGLVPRSLADRWDDEQTSDAFRVTAEPEEAPAGPAIEDHDSENRVPYGARYN